MSAPDFKVSWKSFQDQLFDKRRNLLEDKLFSDVTLVSDDMIPLEALKIILSSASSIF